jgi:hypothetical protein
VSLQEPEGTGHPVVQQCEHSLLHCGGQCSGVPGAVQIQGVRADPTIVLGEAERPLLVVELELRELGVRLGNVLDPHSLSHFAVEVERRESFLGVQATPSVGVDPFDRLVDERRQHVEHVVVGDVVPTVHSVDRPKRFTPPLGVVSVLEQFGHQ